MGKLGLILGPAAHGRLQGQAEPFACRAGNRKWDFFGFLLVLHRDSRSLSKEGLAQVIGTRGCKA